ncbi:hypothetical protein [Salinarimonas rosea]|uniref:hypothetical protein n=1 Tax=Salinarimonas rosea TaxID=552063 RepID=UPI000425CDBF|nr:hypothetical protein [Salinarimonas rosea]
MRTTAARLLAALALATSLGLAGGAQAITNTQDTNYDRVQQDQEFYSVFRSGA